MSYKHAHLQNKSPTVISIVLQRYVILLNKINHNSIICIMKSVEYSYFIIVIYYVHVELDRETMIENKLKNISSNKVLIIILVR